VDRANLVTAASTKPANGWPGAMKSFTMSPSKTTNGVSLQSSGASIASIRAAFS